MSSITIFFGIFTLLTTSFCTTLRNKLGFNKTKTKPILGDEDQSYFLKFKAASKKDYLLAAVLCLHLPRFNKYISLLKAFFCTLILFEGNSLLYKEANPRHLSSSKADRLGFDIWNIRDYLLTVISKNHNTIDE